LKIAAKPLQMEIWSLLTANRKLPTPYPTVPSPTPYDLSFGHNTSVTDRQSDGRRTTTVPKTPYSIAVACQKAYITRPGCVCGYCGWYCW